MADFKDFILHLVSTFVNIKLVLTQLLSKKLFVVVILVLAVLRGSLNLAVINLAVQIVRLTGV